MAKQTVTALTQNWRKVQTVDGSTFRLLNTTHHDQSGELMARVMDQAGKIHEFYAVELKLK